MKPSTIKQLRSAAHRNKLKPIVTIGMKGLTDAVMAEIKIALDHHELLKLKIPALDKEEKFALVNKICSQTQAEKIQLIGHVLVIFKLNPDIDQYKNERKEKAS
ncbi:MAG: YhbY family RNA-binding protein [Gammaproteobacteria bacterium]|nr:YhbY family RNA-binding protein [Gammaproteobacteria bacterium]